MQMFLYHNIQTIYISVLNTYTLPLLPQLLLRKRNYNEFENSIYLSTYRYQGNVYVLKLKPTITKYAKCFVAGISSRKNLFKEIETVNENGPGKSTSYKQMLVG